MATARWWAPVSYLDTMCSDAVMARSLVPASPSRWLPPKTDRS